MNRARYIETLKEAVAIKSVSALPAYRPELTKMVHWTAQKLKKIGATVELADIGKQTLHDGRILPLPQVILGTLGNVCKAYFRIKYNNNGAYQSISYNRILNNIIISIQ